jgi:hypothetical protein
LIYIESGYGLMLARGFIEYCLLAYWMLTCSSGRNECRDTEQGTDDVECGASEGAEIRVTNFQKAKNM